MQRGGYAGEYGRGTLDFFANCRMAMTDFQAQPRLQSRSSGFIGQWLLIGGAFWQKRNEKHLAKPGKLPVPEIR